MGKKKGKLASKEMTVSEMARSGGVARAKGLSKERRSEIARRASNARWAKRNLERHSGS